jgi:hypothetical protein
MTQPSSHGCNHKSGHNLLTVAQSKVQVLPRKLSLSTATLESMRPNRRQAEWHRVFRITSSHMKARATDTQQRSLESDRYLHLALGSSARHAALDSALSACSDFGLSQARACELVSALWNVLRGWRPCFEQLRVLRRDIAAVAPAFRHIDDIATRELRRKIS